MSFKNLREIILAQYPSAELEFDFSQAKKDSLDEDTKVVSFLNSKNASQVNIAINQDTFSLKNVLAEPLASIVLPNLEEAARDPNRVVYWYKRCVDAGLQPSHAGTLSYFLKNFHLELDKLKTKGKISEKEIETAVKSSSVLGREPINKKLEECYHELNAVTSQIQEIETEKISIEQKAEKKINLYLKLILLATLIQFVTFYYAIFHVDWLGWDIIEPITYTVQCLTVLFGLRFYRKYGLGRDLETMRILNRNRMINKDKVLKTRYHILTRQLAYKQKQQELLKLQRDLYLNRRNYYQFFFTHTVDVSQTS